MQHVVGTPEQFHHLEFPDDPQPTIWVFRPTEATLVLGSRQKSRLAELKDQLTSEDGAPSDINVCVRRSGGGAVLVDPAVLWLDVLIPADDAAASADIGHTFLQVGAAWQRAFAAVGLATQMWAERAERSAEADDVCFAGRGWGELTVTTNGRSADGRSADGLDPGWVKVLGLSQRRTRWGARVQCLATFTDQTAAVAAMLRGEAPPAVPERAVPDRAVPGLAGLDLAGLEAAAVAELTRL